MFGCLGRLGCLLLLLVVAAVAYVTRDRWMSRVGLAPVPAATAPSGAPASPADASAREGEWRPLTTDGVARARRAVTGLAARNGPAYVDVRPADLASYIFDELSKQLPPSASDVQATARGDRLYVRASVKLSDFGGTQVLGPLAGVLGEREPMQFGGTLEVLRPGLAQFRVREIRIRELGIPSPAIPRLIAQLRRGEVPAGVAADALPLSIPPFVGDVRVQRGMVTIYKRVP